MSALADELARRRRKSRECRHGMLRGDLIWMLRHRAVPVAMVDMKTTNSSRAIRNHRVLPRSRCL